MQFSCQAHKLAKPRRTANTAAENTPVTAREAVSRTRRNAPAARCINSLVSENPPNG